MTISEDKSVYRFQKMGSKEHSSAHSRKERDGYRTEKHGPNDVEGCGRHPTERALRTGSKEHAKREPTTM
jgi:hypothetical protein